MVEMFVVNVIYKRKDKKGERKMRKTYIRTVNGIVDADELQCLAWRKLDKYTESGRPIFSIIFFLKGGNKFNSTVSDKVLKNAIIRMKKYWRDENPIDFNTQLHDEISLWEEEE